MKLSKTNQKAVKIFYCLMSKCFFLIVAAALGAKNLSTFSLYFPWREPNGGGSLRRGQNPVGVEGEFHSVFQPHKS